jgi:hypothetical protein
MLKRRKKMKHLLTLKTLVAVFAILTAGSLASADTIQDVINGGNSVVVGDLVFSNFAVSAASSSLAGVNAANVDLDFLQNGNQVTLEFSPNSAYGSAWETSPLSFGGSFEISYKVTAVNGHHVDSTGLSLDSAAAGATSYVKVSDDKFLDAAESQLAGQLNVQTGMSSLFGKEKLGGFSSFNPAPDELYVNSTVSLLAMNGTPASISQFSQTYDAVPEPGTLGLLGMGSLAMIVRRRRRK